MCFNNWNLQNLMIKLHVVQAEYGDSLILESGVGKNSTTILIDGGPYQTFEKHLKPNPTKVTNRM
jgi:hypothetical protein